MPERGAAPGKGLRARFPRKAAAGSGGIRALPLPENAEHLGGLHREALRERGREQSNRRSKRRGGTRNRGSGWYLRQPSDGSARSTSQADETRPRGRREQPEGKRAPKDASSVPSAPSPGLRLAQRELVCPEPCPWAFRPRGEGGSEQRSGAEVRGWEPRRLTTGSVSGTLSHFPMARSTFRIACQPGSAFGGSFWAAESSGASAPSTALTQGHQSRCCELGSKKLLEEASWAGREDGSEGYQRRDRFKRAPATR